MGNCVKTMDFLNSDYGREMLSKLYTNDFESYNFQLKRYINLIDKYKERFGDDEISLFSSPGRSEIGGNHTDHNSGKVLAASIDLDTIGIASKRDDNCVCIYSIEYNEDYEIKLSELAKINGEKGSRALTRGILSEFSNKNYNIGGFNIAISSNVISAAGLSSSASYEMLICKVIDYFYNEDKIDKTTYALIGKFAENVYWEKSSGLLDQMTCAYGGIITIDFKDNKKSYGFRNKF
jgi:galactokinase